MGLPMKVCESSALEYVMQPNFVVGPGEGKFSGNEFQQSAR